jgi:hypothetical protein
MIVIDNQSLEEPPKENRNGREYRPNDGPKEYAPEDFAERNGDIAHLAKAKDIDEITEANPVEQTDVRFVIGEGRKEAEYYRHDGNKGDKENRRE